MDVRQMLEHLTLPLKTAMGEFPAASKNKAFMQTWFMQTLFIYVLPWPKAKAPTAIEYDEVLNKRKGPDVPEGINALIGIIERFAVLPPDFRFHDSPIFGALTRKQWGDLQYRHADHHLKQFGA